MGLWAWDFTWRLEIRASSMFGERFFKKTFGREINGFTQFFRAKKAGNGVYGRFGAALGGRGIMAGGAKGGKNRIV